MNNYKQNLRMWAKSTISPNDQSWEKYQEKLTKEELAEMLNILSGYFRASAKGREIVKPWLNTAQ